MTRDIELIRKLLFFFDEKPGPEHVDVPPIPGYDDSTIKYHCNLLYDAGYLRCEPVTTNTGRVIYVLPFELTWQGHEFLDSIRTQHIWDEVMRSAKDRGLVSTSVEYIKKMADSLIRKRLGLSA